MSTKHSRRLFLLKLYQLLLSETDENHQLSAFEMQNQLRNNGIMVDIQTIKSGIKALREDGIDITECKEGHHNIYRCNDHIFDLVELKMLSDAVSAANCITEKKTTELIHKLQKLTGPSRSELTHSDGIFSLVKSSNENIFRYIDTILSAIKQEKKVSFYYKKDRRYRTEYGQKKLYIVDPIATVFSNGYYYLVAETPDHPNEVVTYRIDRMEALQKDRQCRELTEPGRCFDPDAIRTQVFSMYTGTPEQVTLKIAPDLISAVDDRFGKVVPNTPETDGSYLVTVPVHVSPTFLAWCCTFGSKLKIIAPESAVEAMRQLVSELAKLYDE